MATLADVIEAYLKRLLLESNEGYVEVRRCELAMNFSCVPSQINYVLETRFTPERGYVVESRRGGGGYIRIINIWQQVKDDELLRLYEAIGDRIARHAAEDLLHRLVNARLLDATKAEQIRRFIEAETGAYRPPWADRIRASVLKGMLLVLYLQNSND
ncbi:MAG TPA: CtsR family transcriptional regulator [Firmicutes bacterium]|nr:CtsR family transcriptional regulator [Bacillota bacterium]